MLTFLIGLCTGDLWEMLKYLCRLIMVMLEILGNVGLPGLERLLFFCKKRNLRGGPWGWGRGLNIGGKGGM